jgi:hypothetical protein
MEKRPRGRPSKVTDAMKIEIIDAFRHGAHVKDVMRDFKLSHGIVHGIKYRAVRDGILDPLVLVRIDQREAARRGWETRRARYDVSELAPSV